MVIHTVKQDNAEKTVIPLHAGGSGAATPAGHFAALHTSMHRRLESRRPSSLWCLREASIAYKMDLAVNLMQPDCIHAQSDPVVQGSYVWIAVEACRWRFCKYLLRDAVSHVFVRRVTGCASWC